MFVSNEGYDLGMFYKAVQAVNLEEYHQIACINDSNILFNELKSIMSWGENKKFDFWGIIDSYQKPWFSTHVDNYHLQSHFLVFNKKALQKLPLFFQSLDLEQFFNEKNEKRLRQKVINKWEIGLTQFFLKEGLSLGSFFESKSFSLDHHIKKTANLSHGYYFRLIEAGYPLIKKKVVLNNRGLKYYLRPGRKWDKLILKYGNKDWEIEALIKELKQYKKERPVQ
jgi:lipopolysaccharide biosynthesis protein